MDINASIFRAYDIRGIVHDSLSNNAVFQIGQAFASEAIRSNCKRIVIGRDGRLSSPELAISLTEGLISSGCEVIDIGMVPTPILYYATHTLKTGTGMMITGSHNPPEYNGIKMMLDGKTLHGEAIQALKNRIIAQDFIQGEGKLSSQDIKSTYIQEITQSINIARPLKIAIDCGNGVAAEVAGDLFRALGLEPIELFCVVDGTFPNHHPNPSVEENLRDLQKTVVENQLDLGLAFDGDGDRLGVVDSQGTIIWPDRQMILYARDILKRHANATIIYDVKCTRHLGDAIKQSGGTGIMSQTGHSIIKARMQETGALLAGEMSGHIFFKERWYGFDDGLYTAARLLEILANSQISVKEIFNTLPNSVNTPELNISFTEGEHYQFIDQFKAQVDFPGAEISSIDGIRADFEDGWGLVRASNTTPCLVLRFEADNDAALQRIQTSFKKALLKIDPELEIPF